MTVRATAGRASLAHASLALDVAVAVAVLAGDAIWIAAASIHHDIRGGQALGLTLVAAACSVALARWRRHGPLRLAVIVLIATALADGIVARGLLSQRTGLYIALVAYALGSWCTRRRTAVAVVIGVAVVVVLAAGHRTGHWRSAAVSATAVLIAPWLAGEAARLRRVHLADVEDRLARADSERDERGRRAVLEERARIARELHDVVAHHVSLIGVQAGAARTTLGAGHSAAQHALSGIEASSRDAVREMRRLVNVLDAGDGSELMAPPRRTELETLCAGFAAAELVVEQHLDAVVDDLAAGPALTIYRIVEEALTNITRHSRARRCTVEVTGVAESVRIVIDDPGPSHPRAPVPPPGAGRGLTGMRERVGVFDGRFVAGPNGLGFRVDVTLPVQPT